MSESYTVKDVLGKTDSEIMQVEYLPPQAYKFIEFAIEKYIPLEKRVNTLEEKMKIVEEEIDKNKKRLDNLEGTYEEVIIIEEIDMNTAKQKVLEYTNKHKIFDIEELHRNIRCDLRLLIKIIDELKEEGRIIEES